MSLKGATLIETEEVLSNLHCLRLDIVVSLNLKLKTFSDSKVNDAFVTQEFKESLQGVWTLL